MSTDAVISFQQDVYSVSEVAGQSEVCVSLVENIAGIERITLSVMSQDDSATGELEMLLHLLGCNTILLSAENIDYTSIETTLTFGTGLDTTQCFDITVLRDVLLEHQERFFLVLQSSENIDVGGVTTSTVFIIDDQGMFYGY